MPVFDTNQYVCKVCGYNMIGYHPQNCPFCGAPNENFITAEECAHEFKVIKKKVNPSVNMLLSSPKLGLEHAAYQILTGNQTIMIDCPSTFDRNLDRMDKIMFTHHHFLGASNLYRNYYTAFIWIHKNDSANFLANKYPFDKKFEDNFNLEGIRAYYINGHTHGFTFYTFQDVVFICDYVFLTENGVITNPYGPRNKTIDGLMKIKQILEINDYSKVCGYNYAIDYKKWKRYIDEFLKEV
ncbi:MAG: rubredoxin-like domain-containing protein [Candidatus Thorarchaeota archaeon]